MTYNIQDTLLHIKELNIEVQKYIILRANHSWAVLLAALVSI